MNVIKTIDELNAIKAAAAEVVNIRVEGKDSGVKDVLVCGGTGCTSSGSMNIIKKLEEEIERNGLKDKVNIIKTGCFGLCALGPIMIVYPEGTFYSKMEVDHIPEIVSSHLKDGIPVKKYLYAETVEGDTIKSLNDTAFYAKQHRVALRNCGLISPEHIEEYIARDGYQALHKVLTSMSQDDVINCLLASGLRGRGGAGFPTGRKWQFAKASVNEQKYVCCNADEGDPGAFMDRSVLEGDPHSVIEAMAIAGYAIGANQGYIYVRAEYPIAVERLEIAIKQAEEAGMLGDNIFGTGFKFHLGLRLGAGAFVCGEETALMTSIEGNRGEPRCRPPFPAVKGLFGKPTILNNVETYANVCQIILNGPEWFAAMGTEKSKGTKVFALGGKKFKAAQTGGPSGGCIPPQHLDIPIDYDNLIAIGSMMGSGGLIVMDEDNCMVDIAKFFLEFTVDESCGKCTPCRIGTKRMYEILTKITEGKATMDDLEKLEKLCYYIKDNALCGLGQTAPNPVLSTLRYFKDEYIAHVQDKKCPAGVCKSLLAYKIDPAKCKGCSLCAKKCPVGAISGELRNPFTIDTNKCIKCGVCASNCKFGAIEKA